MKKLIIIGLFFISIGTVNAQILFETKEKIGRAADGNGNPLNPPFELKVQEYSKIEGLFNKFKDDEWLQFGYPQNGCQYRAHTLARVLKEHGIEANKIWTFKPSLLGDEDQSDLTIPDPNFPGDTVIWNYHVAPVVKVQMPGNAIDTLVLDPSLFDELVPYRTWLQKINNPKQYYTFVNAEYVDFEDLNEKTLDGTWYTEGYTIDKKWIPTNLCQGRIFHIYIQNEVLPIRKRMDEINAKLSGSNAIARHQYALSMELEHLTKIYKARKKLATSSYLFGELPSEYQSMFISCQEYQMECIYYYWGNIQPGQATYKCKF
ncbi:MAG: protein-glutamine glutaminase family protein [Bacteroidota bacterium]